ncbi:hypothetical protein FRC10_009665 [Ceratobasidium sp. 414]|nr:hypothetical protein FRC10_009665 [Ceratobasidium sp. 414]
MENYSVPQPPLPPRPSSPSYGGTAAGLVGGAAVGWAAYEALDNDNSNGGAYADSSQQVDDTSNADYDTPEVAVDDWNEPTPYPDDSTPDPATGNARAARVKAAMAATNFARVAVAIVATATVAVTLVTVTATATATVVTAATAITAARAMTVVTSAQMTRMAAVELNN